MKTPQSLILFDGVCNLCNGAINFIIDHDPDKKFKFASLQSEEGRQRLLEAGITDSFLDSIVLIQQGTVKTKSEAALTIAKDLKGLWPLLTVFKVVPRFIRDWLYDRVAASRYRLFGKSDQCRVPTPELKERFL